MINNKTLEAIRARRARKTVTVETVTETPKSGKTKQEGTTKATRVEKSTKVQAEEQAEE